MKWMYYRLYTVAQARPGCSASWSFGSESQARFRTVERSIADFYRANRTRISGMLMFHYTQTADEPVVRGGDNHVTVRRGDHTEFIRLRLQTDDHRTIADEMEKSVIEPLSAGDAPALAGWQFFSDYDAARDIGTRFGDPDNGVDVTDAVVKLLTGATELRFVLNEHPEFEPNHDVIHLYCNTLGLAYPQEIAALEKRVRKMRDYMSKRDQSGP